MESRDVECDVFYSDGGHVNKKMVGEKEKRQNFVQFVCLGVIFTTKLGQLSVHIAGYLFKWLGLS